MTADPAPAGFGRPTTYDADLAMGICERIMEGESLSRICQDEHMPSRGQVLRWLGANPEFRVLYRQARVLAAELLADELIAIADDATHDFRTNDRGDQVLDREAVLRSKLRVDARKWVLAKLLPRTYGGGEDAAPEAAAPGEAPMDQPSRALALTPLQRQAVARALAMRYRLEAEDAA